MSGKLLCYKNGIPYSNAYDDIYYSSGDCIGETTHVFIEGNKLGPRWVHLSVDESFTIFESGFGTGLNFLVTMHEWQKHQTKGAKLKYIAFEAQPLTVEQCRELFQSGFERLQPQIETYLKTYKNHALGINHIHFCENIELVLLCCDVTEVSKFLTKEDTFDAIFMDGFSPAKNPDMWSNDLCQLLSLHSKVGTTVATFTVAGSVRRHLQSAGFQVAKQTGFGNKRSMLTAYMAET